MQTQSRFFKTTATLCAAATAALMLAGTQPAAAGASTGSWKYYPQGVYGGGYGRGYGYNPYYSSRPVYGHGYGYGYGPRGYYDGYDRPYYQRRSDPGAAVAAGVVGLAAGAILGGALSQRSNRTVSCTQYRSYNPRTGTFIGKNGQRYSCR